MLHSLLFISAFLFSPEITKNETPMSISSEDHHFTILVDGMKNDKGKVYMQIKDEAEENVKELILDVLNGKSKAGVNLPTGKYAVQVFYDENNNGELDTNIMGVPTEPYGFSNNVRGRFGPPSFEKQLVTLDDDKKITITVK